MLFQQSVISFVAAIALATSVSASAIAARGSAPVCPAGPSPYCCGASLAPVNVPNNIKSSLTSLAPNLDQGKVVGQNCVTPPAQGCPDGEVPLCCPTLVNYEGVPFGVNCQSPTN